ncbi:hypothetical protein E1N52_35830 [Paraburkholderia guartelaensis]|uniref:Uncharacterized protein n=1 Tax=Paraburkholderia guartelaensis TaxID=2546446 RepID=A0A4R5L5N1_9BURK|nr:hypothetical protein E1N52_35830 [Paraburkholderia guartelaensis]
MYVPRLCVAIAVTLLSLFTHAEAAPRNEQFDCESTPHEFVSSLIRDRWINAQPNRVEANSVNAFRPVDHSHPSAFGFSIYVVLGYAPDDPLFERGAGAKVVSPLYGVVVKGPVESVRTRVREANSDATVRSVVPLLLTAIVCGG